MDIDELKAYRGADYKISDNIIIRQPTLGEICDYGEFNYYSLIYHITSTPSDLKWQLADAGIDFTEVNEYELFHNSLINSLTKDKTYIIFGDLDFTKFAKFAKEDGSIVLAQQVGIDEQGNPSLAIIDEYTYILITDYLRSVHDFKKNIQKPANEFTKQILIEDAREEYLRNLTKESHSRLLSLVSSMVNSEGFKLSHNEVWDMKIYAFMDSVKRISKIKNAELLLQSGYSGYGINLKDIDKKQLDWLGELN